MNGAFFSSGMIGLGGRSLKRWLGLWAISEVLVFLLVVQLIGAGPTLLLMLLTSVLGVTVLRRVGLGAAQHLRRHMAEGGSANAVFVDGSLTALGALLMILPGFVSDIAGLALATPSIRQQLAARFRVSPPTKQPPMGRRSGPDVIDLGPDDWRVIDRAPRS